MSATRAREVTEEVAFVLFDNLNEFVRSQWTVVRCGGATGLRRRPPSRPTHRKNSIPLDSTGDRGAVFVMEAAG